MHLACLAVSLRPPASQVRLRGRSPAHCATQPHRKSLGLQVSYAIGVAQPLSVFVDTYGTGTIPDKEILAKILEKFDFRPGATLVPGASTFPLPSSVRIDTTQRPKAPTDATSGLPPYHFLQWCEFFHTKT